MFDVLPDWITPKRFEHDKTLTKTGKKSKVIVAPRENSFQDYRKNETKVEQSISITNLPLDKVDSFLVHDFSFHLRNREEVNSQKQAEEVPFLLPMIIEISNPDWKSKMPLAHHKEFYRSDHIVACYGSIEDVESLNNDPEVICVEAADVG
jgi:hypothetical protein